ncbi:hypothetical protein OC834_002743 [Tilletia horrida]|nr:hypothetical protein OC834_002743 [Tilletia horrida]
MELNKNGTTPAGAAGAEHPTTHNSGYLQRSMQEKTSEQHQQAAAASAIVKAAAKAAAASVQGFEAGGGGNVGGRSERAELDGSKKAGSPAGASASTSSPRAGEPPSTGTAGEQNSSSPGFSNAAPPKADTTTSPPFPPGWTIPAHHHAVLRNASPSSGSGSGGDSGFGLGLGAGLIPPHLLWRPPSSSSSSSSTQTNGGHSGEGGEGNADSPRRAGRMRGGGGGHEVDGRRHADGEDGGRGLGSDVGQSSSPAFASFGSGAVAHGAACGGGSGEFRTGAFHNFAQNVTCLGCGAAKPVGACGDLSAHRHDKDQDKSKGPSNVSSPSSFFASSAFASPFQPRAASSEAQAQNNASASSMALLTAQMNDLIAAQQQQQQQQQRQTGRKDGTSPAFPTASGTAASQWAPGGALSSSQDVAYSSHQHQHQSQDAYQLQQQQQYGGQKSFVGTGAQGSGGGSKRMDGTSSGYMLSTSTPPPQGGMSVYAPSSTSANAPATSAVSTSSLTQASMAALDAFRAAAGSHGLSLGHLPLSSSGSGTTTSPTSITSSQYLPSLQALAQQQQQAHAPTQRGGTVTPATVSSLYQLQLQHAAMKNQNGMPLPQSSGPLARMQALTSAFGGMPMPSSAAAAQGQTQTQSQTPGAHAHAHAHLQTYTSAMSVAAMRYAQQKQQSAQVSVAGGTGSGSMLAHHQHQLPLGTTSSSTAGATLSYAGMQAPNVSTQQHAHPQLPPLDWSSLSKSAGVGSSASGASAPVTYPTAAPYRSAHMHAHTQLQSQSQHHQMHGASLPANPVTSAAFSGAAAAAAATATAVDSSVGVGLNLPGGVEGLAIKQPWLSTAPSNAATAARLATLGIGIGPGVNPNVGGGAAAGGAGGGGGGGSGGAGPSGGPGGPGGDIAGGDRRKSAQGHSQNAQDGGSNNPPIVNTGNSGPMCVQPGDWVCSSCGFVNWRRRRVCLRCFPFAEGNETAASLANGAILAAQLAAGVSPSKVDTASLLKSPARSREAQARAREQAVAVAGMGGGAGGGFDVQGISAGQAIGLGLNLGPSPGPGQSQSHNLAVPRYPSTAGTPAMGLSSMASLPAHTQASQQAGFMLKPFGSAPTTTAGSPSTSPLSLGDVPNWAALAQAERFGLEGLQHQHQHQQHILGIGAGMGMMGGVNLFAQDWQRRTSQGATRTMSGPVLPSTRAPGGPTSAAMHGGTHVRQSSYNSAFSHTNSDPLCSGIGAGTGSGPGSGGGGSAASSAWHASPSIMSSSGGGGAAGGAGIFTPSSLSACSATTSANASTRNIWGASPPRNIGGNKLVDDDDQELRRGGGAGGSGGSGSSGFEAAAGGSGGSGPIGYDGQTAVWKPKPIGSRESAAAATNAEGKGSSS